MKTNKISLVMTLLLMSIAPINSALAASTPWCGNTFFYPIQNSPNAGNLDCSTKQGTQYAECLSSHVINGSSHCLPAAAAALKQNPTDAAAIANYNNLSVYFNGAYANSTQPVLAPAPNVNVIQACSNLNVAANMKICENANAAVLTPNFVVPTAPAQVVVQTPDQCYAAAYTNGSALADQLEKNAKSNFANNQIKAVSNASKAGASKQSLNTACNGAARDKTLCSQQIDMLCQAAKKTNFTYCNNTSMTTMKINCR